MKTAIALLVTILSTTACITEESTADSAVHEAPHDCGPRPLAPGVQASFENVNGFDRVLMMRETYTELMTWKSTASAWMACMDATFPLPPDHE